MSEGSMPWRRIAVASVVSCATVGCAVAVYRMLWTKKPSRWRHAVSDGSTGIEATTLMGDNEALAVSGSSTTSPNTANAKDLPKKKKTKKTVHVCEDPQVIGEDPGVVARRVASSPPPEASVLVEAIRAGMHEERLRILLQQHEYLLVFPTGRTVLHECVESLSKGQEGVLRMFINDFHVGLSHKDSTNADMTALHLAAAAGKESIAIEMVRLAPLEVLLQPNREGWSVLHFAASLGRTSIVEAALTKIDAPTIKKGFLDARNARGSTALHLAVTSRSSEAALVLIAAGCDVKAADEFGATALHLCMLGGFCMYQVAEELLKHGADVSAIDAKGETPLHWAVHRGHGRMSALMVIHGANVEIGDTTAGVTPLHLVAACDDKGLLETFILNNKKICLDVQDVAGRTPLHIAAMRGSNMVADVLLANHASVDALDNAELSPLFWALRNNFPKIASLLVTQRANVERKDQHGGTALLLACFGGRPMARVAEHILDLAPHLVNECDQKGRSPLHFCAAHNDAQLCTALLEAGASINACTHGEEVRPIHWAAREGSCDTLEMLFQESVNRGSSPSDAANVMDARNRTSLHWAATQVLQPDHEGSSEYSVSPRHRRAFLFLCTHGGSLSCQDENGRTPKDVLHESADRLVQQGANVQCDIDAFITDAERASLRTSPAPAQTDHDAFAAQGDEPTPFTAFAD